MVVETETLVAVCVMGLPACLFDGVAPGVVAGWRSCSYRLCPVVWKPWEMSMTSSRNTVEVPLPGGVLRKRTHAEKLECR